LFVGDRGSAAEPIPAGEADWVALLPGGGGSAQSLSGMSGGQRVAAPAGFENKISFVWKIAEKLRGHLKPHEYGSVMLPTPALVRLDADVTKQNFACLEVHAKGTADLPQGQPLRFQWVTASPGTSATSVTSAPVTWSYGHRTRRPC
jgi:hypothetical protein